MTGIADVTITGAGRSVTLTADDADRLTRHAGALAGPRLVTGDNPPELYPVPETARFKSRPDLADPDLDFIPAPDVERIAAALIAADAGRFWHLTGAFPLRVAYRWKREGGADGGRATLGKCVKAAPLVKHFGEIDFVIWLAADHLLVSGFTRYQVEALVFHELLHTARVSGKPKTVPHDAELFVAEVERYGLWKTDLDHVGRAVRQLQLPGLAANGYGEG